MQNNVTSAVGVTVLAALVASVGMTAQSRTSVEATNVTIASKLPGKVHLLPATLETTQ